MGVTIFPDPNWQEFRGKTVNLTKFPFWGAIILQQTGSVTVPANTDAWVNIQPPSNETWWVDMTFGVNDDGGTDILVMRLYSYDGALQQVQMATDIVGITPYARMRSFNVTRILTNSSYTQLMWRNGSATTARRCHYSYCGFKLSTRLWQPERNQDSVVPHRLPLGGRLLAFPRLKDRAFVDPKDRIRYLLFEEDRAIAPETGEVVERLSVEVLEEDLKKNIALFQADPAKTGWDRILKHLGKEGIALEA